MERNLTPYWLILVVLMAGGLWWYGGDSPQERPLLIAAVRLTPVDDATLAGFKDGLRELGYREGEDIRYFHEQPAGEIGRLDGYVRRALAQQPDLIFVSSTPGTLAVQQATRSHPVVFCPVNDPVDSGIVKSLKAPGGNITGIRLPRGEDLRLQWLTKLAPGAKRVLFPYNPVDRSAQQTLAAVKTAAEKLGVELMEQPVRDSAELERDLDAFSGGVDAIFLPRDSTIESHINAYVATANRLRIPLCAPSLTQVEAGALLSYGFMHYEMGRQAARLADQVLQGVAPADLPVETARSYLAINLTTAEAIGLDIPEDLLRQADKLLR